MFVRIYTTLTYIDIYKYLKYTIFFNKKAIVNFFLKVSNFEFILLTQIFWKLEDS